MTAPLLISVSEACRLLSVSRTTLYKLMALGQLPKGKRVGRARRLRLADVQKYAESKR